jgi:hypothetical protein
LSKANPAIPEVNCNAPDFFTIASVVCFSDPSLKPSIRKIVTELKIIKVKNTKTTGHLLAVQANGNATINVTLEKF